MASYISSNANRFYVAPEQGYGNVGSITAANRIPAVKLSIQQRSAAAQRHDKTGSRTFPGLPSGGRRRTTFELKTYLSDWDKAGAAEPAYGPLFRAALGSTALTFAGGTAGAGAHDRNLTFGTAHGLISGQALTYAGEIRFVQAIVSATSVLLNAPFTNAVAPGTTLGRTLTLMPTTELPSVSIFDYWSPGTAVQRILCGAGVNKLQFQLNSDFHVVSFSGAAQELIDSSSFSGEVGALQAFPSEPALDAYSYSIVPGHMGQVWMGSSAERFYTVTDATITLENDLELRASEFGSSVARALSPGQRQVTAGLALFSQDDDSTKALYQAAKQQSPIEAMFQLGQVEGQLIGIYLKSLIPEVPEYDDRENRLQWKFRESRAQGTADDEIVVAFA